jgi:hypothetical protein
LRISAARPFVGRAQRQALHGRQVLRGEPGRVAVGHAFDVQVLGLGLVEGRERRAAGIADQHHLLVAALAQEPDSGAQVLDHALHQQQGVVAGIARIEAHAGHAAGRQRGDQVVPHEVAGGMHHDRRGAPGARRLHPGTVDARTQQLQPGLAFQGRPGLDVEDRELEFGHGTDCRQRNHAARL